MKHIPLIAPKHISEFTDEEYHAYVRSMYGLRKKKPAAKKKKAVKK